MRVEDNDKKFGFFDFLTDSHNSKDKISKIPGQLYIQDGGEAHLDVFISSNVEFQDTTARIVGEIYQKNNLRYVVLEDCLLLKQSFNSEMKIFTFIAGRTFFIKDPCTLNQEIQCNTFSFHIEGLNQWIKNHGIKTTYDKDKVTFVYEKPKEIICKIDNDIQVSFEYSGNIKNNICKITHVGMEITEKIYCKLTSSKIRPLDDFIEIAHKIKIFLCFIMNCAVNITDVTLTAQHISDSKLQLYYRDYPFVKNKPSLHPLFTFNLIKENITSILNKWIELYDKTTPSMHLYLSTQINTEFQFVETRFLTLIQALEKYHREVSGNEVSGKKVLLRKRLKEIIKPLKTLIRLCNEDHLISKIVNTRNYFTHYNPNKESTALKKEKLFNLCLKVEGIFQINILRALDIPDPIIKDIIKTGRHDKGRLKRKIQLLKNEK